MLGQRSGCRSECATQPLVPAPLALGARGTRSKSGETLYHTLYLNSSRALGSPRRGLLGLEPVDLWSEAELSKHGAVLGSAHRVLGHELPHLLEDGRLQGADGGAGRREKAHIK